MAFSLRARFVYPVDRPPIENGVVTIDGERIIAVGAAPAAGAVVRDLGEVALLPGLVNAHTHLEFSGLARPLGTARMPLPDWIRDVLSHRGSRPENVDKSLAAGCRECLGHGVTGVGEIAASETGADSPLPPIDLSLFVEVIGFSRARAESALSAACERLDALTSLRSPGLKPGLSPHAPYTVSPDLLRQLVNLARQRELPVAMHVAESSEELELLAASSGPFQKLLDERSMWDDASIPHGSRPLDYLRELSRAPRSLVIHGNYLDSREHEFLAASADRMTLIHCPRTHAYFGHPVFPLRKLLSMGVRVALGTDSRASNPDLSVWSEMRYVAKLHLDLPPTTILRLGTLSGAEALGRAEESGSITAGKVSNLLVLPLPAGRQPSADDALGALLASDAPPASVWLHGRET